MRAARTLYAGMAWLFFGAVVVQVFLAGLGLLGGGDMHAHIGFGFLLPLLTIPLLLLAWAAQPDRRTFRLTVLLLFVTFLQTFLPGLRQDAPVLAALHPVNALLIFWVGLTIARGATAMARRPAAAANELPAVQEA
ncbi:MAG TPA: hypothetical protein VFY43_03855 [Candidatus Limnocylindria bacterium]|nr:hypothetical protein [Candidatus Limnocylindria bacterium]